MNLDKRAKTIVILSAITAFFVITGAAAVTALYLFMRTEIQVKDGRFVLDTPTARVEGEIGAETTWSFVLNNENPVRDSFSDFKGAMIPLEIAERLKAEYGDFFQCGSPGAGSGMKAIEFINLVATSDEAEESIDQMKESAKDRNRRLVISFQGAEMVMPKDPNRSEDRTYRTRYFHVKSLRIERENF